MDVPPTNAYLEKLDPSRRQSRLYALHIMPTLFGDWTLVREWGRIGSPGRTLVNWFDSCEQAEDALQRIKRQKMKKGYRE